MIPRYRLIVAGLVGVSLLVLVLGLVSKPALVSYHRWAMMDACKEVGGPAFDYPPFCEHRESLRSLGYFEYREVSLRNIHDPSKEREAMFAELDAKCGLPTSSIEYCSFESPDCLRIWATPAEMNKILAIIDKHDVPQAKTPSPE